MIGRFIAYLQILNGGEIKAPSNNFHIIRYALSLLVIYSHSFALLGFPEPGLYLFTYGNLAVKCFFALSGYLITSSYLRINNLFHYFANRLLRILPGLFVALILSHYIGRYFNFYENNPIPHIINGPIWTLSWEFLCYFLCGLLAAIGLLTTSSLGAILIAGLMLLVTLDISNDFSLIIAPLMLLFFIGGYIQLHKKYINFNIFGFLCLMILIITCIDPRGSWLLYIFKYIPFLYGPNFEIQKYLSLLFLCALPGGLIFVSYFRPCKSLENDYSYGMYILAWPVQQVLVCVYKNSLSPISLFIISWVITHIFAMCLWHTIEKRALKFKF
jgi:peptidoglycan/LPS O-acetylase OafA/YrhL